MKKSISSKEKKYILVILCWVLFVSILPVWTSNQCISYAALENRMAVNSVPAVPLIPLSVPASGSEFASLTRTYLLSNDAQMNGVSSKYDWYFDTDKNWAINDGVLELHYSLSDLLLADLSSMTIYFNNHPIKSISLRTTRLNEELVQIISLPKEEFVEGQNTISLRGHARLTESFCTDDNSVSNWIRLYKSSNIEIKYNDNLDNALLKSYPAPFAGLISNENLPVTVVFDRLNDFDTLGAGLTLLSFLAGQTEKPEKQFQLKAFSSFDWQSQGPRIYLGSLNALPEILKKQLPSNIEHPKVNEVLLVKTKEPIGLKTAVFILSEDPKMLIRGVKALHETDLVKQMEKDWLIVKPETLLETKIDPNDPYVSLKSIGLNGIEYRGPFRQTSSFGVNMAGRQLNELGSKILLNFRYSENLDFNSALMSVYVNNIPIASKRLTLEASKADKLEIAIPKELLGLSYLDVKIVFDLEMSKGICDIKPTEMPWAYVTPDSFLYLPSHEKSISLFENLPAPFTTNNTLQMMQLVISQNLNIADIEGIGKLIAFMGSNVKNNQNQIEVIAADKWEMPSSTNMKHIIVYEKPVKGGIIEKINNLLWFKVNANVDQILSNEKLQLLPEFQKNAGFVELKTVPEWNGKTLMAIYSLNADQLSKTLAHLYDEKKRSKIIGDSAIVGLDQASMTFRFQKEPTTKQKITLKDIKPETLILGVFVLAIFAFFSIGTGVILFRNRKTRNYKTVADIKDQGMIINKKERKVDLPKSDSKDFENNIRYGIFTGILFLLLFVLASLYFLFTRIL